jgi:UDP-N-acetyl-D-galactosamine dehydrogenase
MIKKGISVNGVTLMLGITFKENCPDVCNTKIVDVIAALTDYGISVTTYEDPWPVPKRLKEYSRIPSNGSKSKV